MPPEQIGVTMFRPESFRHRGGQYGTRVLTPPTNLAAWARYPIVAAAKDEGGGFSLAHFTDDLRRKANVTHVFGIGLDVDDGSLTVERAAELLSGWWFVAYSTHSSTPELPKTRAILLFSRPLTGEEYELAWTVVAGNIEAHGVTLDRGTKDPSRLWYLPAVRPGARYDYEHRGGDAIDVDALLQTARTLAAAKAEESARRAKPLPTSREGIDALHAVALDRAARAVASEGAGDRHATLCRRAYSLAKLGVPPHRIEDALLPAFVIAAGEHRRREGAKAIADCVAAGRKS